MTFTITEQQYPTHTGELPLGYAIYYGRKFLAYSWSQDGAERALREIRQSSLQRDSGFEITTEERLDAVSALT